ncbi:hypothetical protein [Chryseobacterium polytrichastri]|uniref:Uncharacterized protein n=1 Tax=Chryseobacterium polytrichastri TaxID=1302687 RepID=A0A1M6Y7D1_9FLAO|nr:hypothetical protein [Chryseobacterium polytrichastri]SHL14194.1 hypothetical protein SAMN05444267_1012115 [Chryseobacterium polytrichastri]
MKKIIIPIMFYAPAIAFGQIGIGTPDPHPSAMLDIVSSDKGVLAPRLTSIQRDSIQSKTEGLIIYNTNENAVQLWDSTKWKTLGIPGTAVVGSLTCSDAAHNGNLVIAKAASGVSSSIPYTNGNGAEYALQNISSTGITGLTATLAAGKLIKGNGNLTYTITGTPATEGTANFAINIAGKTCSFARTVISKGSITSLDINQAVVTGSLTKGVPASQVSVSIPYTGGNGGPYDAYSRASGPTTGLTATLAAGEFQNGSGTLTLSITGTPGNQPVGLAIFALTIGGKTASLTIPVN